MLIGRLLKVRGHKGQDIQMSLLMHMLTHTSVSGECWDWRGGQDGKGYGQIRFDGKLYYVTRIIAHLTYGLPLERSDLKVCHSCDNPLCINPLHLFIGTQADNLADMVRKGRQKRRRATPTERDIKLLRLIDAGTSMKDAAVLVGISHPYARTINSIHRKLWCANGHYSPKEK